MGNASVKPKDEMSAEQSIQILKRERPLFEQNFIKNGGSLQFLKWDECSDGTGIYTPDWGVIMSSGVSNYEFDDQIQDHAERATICLLSWVECAKSKEIPEG